MTDLPAYWKKPPTLITTDLYKKIRDLDFGRKVKRTYPYRCTDAANGTRQIELLKSIQHDDLNVAAVTQFCGEPGLSFECLACTQDQRIRLDLGEYDLRQLYNPNNSTYNLEQLRHLAQDVYNNLKRDPVKVKKIEAITKQQSDSKWWVIFRTGRITASIWREVCKTNIARPAISLLRRICHPDAVRFSSASIRYGKKYEEVAVNALYHSIADVHKHIVTEKIGLVIHAEEPCLGASPDAIFRCSCHGTIVVEVKCPYSARDCDDMVSVLTQLSDPYILMNKNGEIILNTNHKYFFQALMQVHLCNASFGYFYIWSSNRQLVFIINRNDKFWNFYKEKAICYFKNVVLPELISGVYTKNAEKT